MKLKCYILFLLIAFATASCIYKKRDPEKGWDTVHVKFIDGTADYIRGLKNQKAKIDSLAMDTTKVLILVKLSDKDKIVKVTGGKFPDDVETTYNILRDKDDRVICALESPTSESGDWDITYRSYFDREGKLFAFERICGFFNSGCTKDDAAHEDLVKFYADDKKFVDSTYTLKDSKGRSLVKSKCDFPYNYPYAVQFDWESFKKTNKINIP